jgi:hypothetical protein
MDSQTLRAAVAEAFVTTGATTPPWPDPHPDLRSPREEEYSRCLDPAKYRIVAARVEAWVQTLTGLGLAVVEETPDPKAGWQDPPRVKVDRAIWLRQVRAGAIPLLVGFRALDGAPDAIVTVGVGEPAVQLTRLPFCGCDACDDGSDYLLRELDKHILAVVSPWW